MVELSPSILAANFLNLEKDIKILEKKNIKYLHLDVMDGRFVPNISFGFPIIKAIRDSTDMILDLHLMIDEPSRYVDRFIDAGCDMITFHLEAEKHIDRLINHIKDRGKMAGIAINPATPIENLEYLIENLDLVLLMSVNPGFGGQKFIDYTLNKIIKLKEIANLKNPNLIIEVDGGIDASNIRKVIGGGANLIVAGSSIFNGNISDNIDALYEV